MLSLKFLTRTISPSVSLNASVSLPAGPTSVAELEDQIGLATNNANITRKVSITVRIDVLSSVKSSKRLLILLPPSNNLDKPF